MARNSAKLKARRQSRGLERRSLEHHGDRHVLHVERECEAEQQDQDRRHDDCDRDAARIADDLPALLDGRARGSCAPSKMRSGESLVLMRRFAVPRLGLPAAACSTMAMNASSIVGSRSVARRAPKLGGRALGEMRPASWITARSQYSASSMKCVVTMTVTPSSGERRDAPPEFAPRQRIGAAGRLVEKQDLRLVHQRGGHRQPLLVAAGKLPARQPASDDSSNSSIAQSRRSRRRRPRRP